MPRSLRSSLILVASLAAVWLALTAYTMWIGWRAVVGPGDVTLGRSGNVYRAGDTAGWMFGAAMLVLALAMAGVFAVGVVSFVRFRRRLLAQLAAAASRSSDDS